MLFKVILLVLTHLIGNVVGKRSKKIFIDNDGSYSGLILLPLLAGYEILGHSASFGSSSLVDSIGSTFEVIDTLNMTSCIPIYAGANAPLLRTNDSFHDWEKLYGELVWEGAYSSFYEDIYSWDDFQYNESLPGALAMINAVKEFPGQVSIFAAGTMTTVAQALSIYPNLAKEAAGLTIMGGYFDGQYASATGGDFVSDLFSDINLIQDPEAAQITLTAPWKSLTIAGNITNSPFHTTEQYQNVINKVGGMAVIDSNPDMKFIKDYVGNGTAAPIGEANLPYWDEVAIAAMVMEDLIKDTIDVSVAVDTAFDSPFYGQMRIWADNLAPRSGIRIGKATIITDVDKDLFLERIIDIYTKNWSQYCAVGGPLGF